MEETFFKPINTEIALTDPPPGPFTSQGAVKDVASFAEAALNGCLAVDASVSLSGFPEGFLCRFAATYLSIYAYIYIYIYMCIYIYIYTHVCGWQRFRASKSRSGFNLLSRKGGVGCQGLKVPILFWGSLL